LKWEELERQIEQRNKGKKKATVKEGRKDNHQS
jgi:hypothetical protein